MKYAIISDVHANLEALQIALKYIHSKKISQIICLGDIVGYGPRPNECMELIKKHAQICLMGNHDHAVLGLTDIYYFNQYAKEALLWTRRQLLQYNKAYLENLPFSAKLNNLLFVHSTPIEPQEWHYIFSEQEARSNLDIVQEPLVFIGHSHIPVIFSYNNGAFYTEKVALNLQEDRYIVNVGSIGQPRDGDPRACFILYDEETASIEFVRLEYPVKETYRQIIDSKLPPFLAMRLLAGQ